MWYLLLLVGIQIIGEVFPISSSGHQALLTFVWQYLTGSYPPPMPGYFDHFLHGPMILILIIFFRKRWYSFLSLIVSVFGRLTQPVFVDDGIFGDVVSKKELVLTKKFFMLVYGLMLSNSVTTFCYLVRGYLHKRVLFIETPERLLLGFVITFFMLLVLMLFNPDDHESIVPADFSYSQHLFLGLVQGCALLPGSSRFALVYVVARLMGVRPKVAFEYTFLLLFPLICAAFFVYGLPGYIRFGLPGLPRSLVLSAVALASIVAYQLYRWVSTLALQEKLGYMAWYLLAGPLAILLFFLFCK